MNIEYRYEPNEYGGIDVIELNYRNDIVYINGELADDYESVDEYLAAYGGSLYDNIVECAEVIARVRV